MGCKALRSARWRVCLSVALLLWMTGGAFAQQQFVSFDAPRFVITHVTLIDGTGGEVRSDQHVFIVDGKIAEVGPAASLPLPAGLPTIDGRGKTLIPGIVGVHNHLHMPGRTFLGPVAARLSPAAGPDPGRHNLPGYGDQRNFELLREAGFTPAKAVRIVTANGATVLGRTDIGTIAPGKRADLVLLNGDLTEDPAVIHAVSRVFRAGVGYEVEALIDSVAGQIGPEN